MKIEVISNDNGILKFKLLDTTVSFVNAMRRLVLDEVKTMAADIVEIRKNDSSLYDEMVAHRIGLMPITTDLESYKLQEECSCDGEGCMSCEAKLSLKKEGPCNVYGSDFECADPKVKPAFDKMLITKLQEDQEIDLVAYAKLGKGKSHSKHNSGYLTYKYLPTLTASKDADVEKISKETGIDFVSNGKIDDAKVLIANIDGLTDYIDSGVLTLEQSEKDFVVSLESFGQLDPKDILSQASLEMQQKLNELTKELKL